LGSKRILVIDDEPDIADFLTTLLADHGYETLAAFDGQQGLELARGFRPDLITLDVTMPGRSGLAIFKELRSDAEFGRIPIYMITGVQEFRPLFYSRALAPPEGFMEKPIDPVRLLREVAAILKTPVRGEGRP